MGQSLLDAANDILKQTMSRAGGAPGVVAMACNRQGNFYEGAAGVRELGKPEAMTTDTVMLLASCTKAVTGVAVAGGAVLAGLVVAVVGAVVAVGAATVAAGDGGSDWTWVVVTPGPFTGRPVAGGAIVTTVLFWVATTAIWPPSLYRRG